MSNKKRLDDTFNVGDKVAVPVKDTCGRKDMVRPFDYRFGILTEVSLNRTKCKIDGETHFAHEGIELYDEDLEITHMLKVIESDVRKKIAMLYDRKYDIVSYLDESKLVRFHDLICAAVDMIKSEKWFEE